MLLIAVLLLSDARSFSFPGGDVHELVTAVSRRFDVAVVASPTIASIPAFTCISEKEPEEAAVEDLYAKIAAKVQCTLFRTESGLAFRPIVMPAYLGPNHVSYGTRYQDFPADKSTLIVQGDQASLHTVAGKHYWTRFLALHKGSSFASVHWFVEDQPVAGCADNLDLAEALKLIFAVHYASVEEKDDSRKVEIDAGPFLSALKNSISERAKQTTDPLNRSRQELYVEALRLTPQSRIKDMMRTRTATTQFQVPANSGLIGQTNQYVSYYLREYDEGPNSRRHVDQGGLTLYNLLSTQWDSSKPFTIWLSGNLSVGVGLPCKEPNTTIVL